MIRRWFRMGVAIAALSSLPLATPSAAAARIVQARTKTSTPLPSTTSATTIQSLTLASGPWTIMSKAFVVDLTSGESDYFRCALFDKSASKQLDVSAGWVASAYPGNMITNLAKLNVTQGSTVTVDQRCWHDHEGISHAYLDPGATLLAFKARTSTGNRLYRTTSSITLPSSFDMQKPVTVASLGLGAGTWLVGLKGTAVNTSGEDSVECRLPGGSTFTTETGVGGNAGWPRASTFAGFNVVTTSGSTVTAKCIAFYGNGPYLDPGLVLWARKVPSSFVGNTCGTVTPSGTTDLVADVRATKLCPIGTGTAASQVGGVRITAGSWVVLGTESALDADTSQFVRCLAKDVTHNRNLDAHATAWVLPVDQASPWSDSIYLGRVSSSVNATIEFRCGQEASGTADSYVGSYILLRP
jgi:hypothetical protein